jgi:hypothetical protein
VTVYLNYQSRPSGEEVTYVYYSGLLSFWISSIIQFSNKQTVQTGAYSVGSVGSADLSHWMCSLEYWMMDKIKKLINPKYCTPSSGSFRTEDMYC